MIQLGEENTKIAYNNYFVPAIGLCRKKCQKKPLSDTRSNTEYSALVFSGNQYKQSRSNDDDHAGREEKVKCLHPVNGLCKSATRR